MPTIRSILQRFCLLALTVVFLSGSLSLVSAQDGGLAPGEEGSTNPKPRTNTVSATVTSPVPPSTPILVNPTNNSYVTVNQPHFVWKGSTDDVGMDHYRLSLDGSTLFDNIPLTATANSNYTLTYDSINNEYTLIPVNGLSDGVHTWQIRATDVSNVGSNSATWTFTIDTLAPTFVISQIGSETVSISAQDISTVPVTPIVLEENEPLIVATGEANSSVQTTLTIPGDPTQSFTTTIAANGTWSLQLGVLPRDVIMTLDFVITDPAGNISVLSSVRFIIPQDVIVFPPVSPTPSPTPTPGVTPDPDATPEPSPLDPEPNTVPSPAPGTIVIPVAPVRETTIRTIQNAFEQLPQPVQDFVNNLPEEVQQVAEDLAPISAAIVSSAVPAASVVAVASQFGWQISPDLIIKILQALGLIPVGKPQGMVLNSDTDEGVAFAVLTVTNADDSDTPLKETVVTDMFGVYKGVNLPPGNYQIQVGHPEYHFPTAKPRPAHLSISDFYKGEVFNVDSNNQALFLIPVDPLVEGKSHSWHTRARMFLAQLSRRSSVMLFPLFFLSGLLAIIFPTIWNWLIFGFYLVMVGFRVRNWFRTPIITGSVINDKGEPQLHAIVRLTEVESNELAAVLLTDKDGSFKFYGKKSIYQLSLNKHGYIWAPDGSPLSLFEIDARQKPYNLVATLTNLEQVYTDLFT